MFFNKFICIKQNNSNDCGCACIATILKKYNINVDFIELKKICELDNNGIKVKNIIKAFDYFNFITKVFRAVNDNDIFLINKFPFITNIIIDDKFSHFIVVYKITKKYIIFSDPLIGIRRINIDEFLKIWTGLVILPFPNKELNGFNIKNKKNLNLKLFFQVIKFNDRNIINISIMSVIITFFNIISAFYMKFIFNNILPNDLKNSLNIFSIGLIILVISSTLLSALREQLMLYLSRNMDISIILNYYKKIILLPVSFFHHKSTGDILSRLDDGYKIRSAFSNIIITIIVDGFMIVIGGIALASQSEKMFLLTLIPVIIYIASILIFKKIIDTANRETMQSQAELMAYMNQSINSIETIKSFNLEQETHYQIEKRFNKFIKHIFHIGFINNIKSSINKLIKLIFGIIILWYGTYEVLNGNINAGTLLAFNSLLVYFLNPIENIVRLQNSIQSAKVALDRLEEIISSSNKNTKEKDKIDNINLNTSIEYINVKFGYNNSNLIINSLNLKINSNDKIALVGETGSGKTTLAKLLLKFYDIQSGEIKIGNYNIKDISTNLLRNKIAYVSQEIYLFYGSILDNIRLNNYNIKCNDIIDICKKIGLDEFINNLPYRYETIIEEGGINLSGGQKQKIAIARALLRRPDILILDEITSNLDSISEELVNKTIDEFSKNKTVFIIAHRLSTIKTCNKIIVLNKGKIIEIGTHQELIKKKGYYFNLWNSNNS